MYSTRWMRLLRLKHGITLIDLSNAAKVTPQRVSQIELSEERSTEYQRELIYEAFSIIAQESRNTTLRRDLRRLEYRLLDYLREDEII